MAFFVGTAANNQSVHGHKMMLMAIRQALQGRGIVCNYGGTAPLRGDGQIPIEQIDTEIGAVSETWTLTYASATSDFSVVGSVTGTEAARASAGTAFAAAGGEVSFLIDDTVTYADGNTITFSVVASTIPTAERWVEDRLDFSNSYECIMHGPGLAAGDQIYIGLQISFEDSPQSVFNLRLRGFSGYVASDDFNNQPGASGNTDTSSSDVYCLLWEQEIDWWMNFNGRRFNMFCRVSTFTHSMGAGFLDLYTTPGQYPYPLYIGADTSSYNSAYTNTSSGSIRNYPNPGATSLRLRFIDAIWQPFYNWFGGSPEQAAGSNINSVWPYRSPNSNSAGPYNLQIQTFSNNYVPIPIILIVESPSENVIGEMNGVFAVSGAGNSVGNIIRAVSLDDITQTGTGNGLINNVFTLSNAVAETWTITFTSATAFTVSGSVSGAQAAGTVGTVYTSDNSEVTFLITAGSTAFVANDTFEFVVFDYVVFNNIFRADVDDFYALRLQ